MRRLIAILLLTVLGLPLLPSALALGQAAGAGLPACCRRAGAHQCGLPMGERALAAGLAQGPAWKAVPERCPYCPASVAPGHFGAVLMPSSRTVSLPHSNAIPLRVRQAECNWTAARYGARQKRGPPVTSLA